MGKWMKLFAKSTHFRATKSAEACPCGWKPGKKTLKPGPALVGNV